MNQTEQIARHLRDVHFGGNWTSVNLKETLADVSWQQATTQVASFHTIAALVYHMNYFVKATLKVLEGGPLDAHEKDSFNVAPIRCPQDWESLLSKTWEDAEALAALIEQLPDTQLWQPFLDEQYGNNYRCLHGPIEHCHYHLGQIAMLKAMLTANVH